MRGLWVVDTGVELFLVEHDVIFPGMPTPTDSEAPALAASPPSDNPKMARLESLDVFRGMTIAGMILVNNPGSWAAIYPPLAHAEWHGWTHTDLVFPFFLFIAGASMAMSFSQRLEKGANRRELLRHALRRGGIIFLIGLLLAAIPYFNLERLRIMGVLQRIGLCYAMAAAIYLYIAPRKRVMIIALALLGYWAAMKWIPVPSYGAGILTPEGNLAAFLDRAILGGHLWKPMWDPEGLLSSIPAICTVLLGSFAGELFTTQSTLNNKVKALLITGVAGIAAGYALHPWFPINKAIWTSSYVLFTAGYACLLLATCYWLIDVKGWRGWSKPFLIFGMNSILAFTLSTFMAKYLNIFKTVLPNGRVGGVGSYLYMAYFAPLFSEPRNASVAFAVCYLLFWLAVMYWFYRRKIFVKI